MKTLLIILLLVQFFCSFAYALETTEVAPERPVIGWRTHFGLLKFHSNFDVYYAHNFNGAASYAVPGAGALGKDTPAVQTYYRLSDIYSHQFAVNLAELQVELEGKEADLNLDFNYGESVALIHRLPSGREFDEVSKYLGEAYVTYHPSNVKGLRISAGKMFSQFGADSFRSQDNPNYSHSFFFSLGGIPYWYTGLKVSYAIVPGTVLASVYVSNGWNTFYSINGAPSYGVRIGFVPFDGVQIYYNGAFGPQALARTDSLRSAHDVSLVFTTGPEFTVLADVLVGSGNSEYLASTVPGGANWTAFWLAAKAGFGNFYIAPRIEYFRDGGGVFTKADQKLIAETVTLGLHLTENLQTRLEFRHDTSDANSFIDKSGAPAASQTTVSASVLFYF